MTVLALIALAVLPGPLGAGAQQPGRHPYTVPHVLRYATGEDVVGLNPHLAQQFTLSFMSSLTMAWLVRYDRHNNPVPELATAVPTRANGGVSADGKRITYHLRRDAKWSDGVPFTADDVRFSVDVVRNPKNNEGTHLGFDLVESVDTPDPYTVVFHLSRAYSGFYVNFFSSGGGNPCVLPKHLLDELATINEAPYNALPVGIGPFKYASWKRAESVEMVPDPLYFGRKPKLQRILFKIIPDRNTVLTQLTTHEIDLWLPVPAAFGDRARAVPGVTLIRQGSYGYNHIDLELEHGALRDPLVRRALRLATDRATILAKIRHGYGILQETPFAPEHPFHVDVPRVPFDVAAANRMLDGAGWRRGADGIRSKQGQRLDFTLATGIRNARYRRDRRADPAGVERDRGAVRGQALPVAAALRLVRHRRDPLHREVRRLDVRLDHRAQRRPHEPVRVRPRPAQGSERSALLRSRGRRGLAAVPGNVRPGRAACGVARRSGTLGARRPDDRHRCT